MHAIAFVAVFVAGVTTAADVIAVALIAEALELSFSFVF